MTLSGCNPPASACRFESCSAHKIERALALNLHAWSLIPSKELEFKNPVCAVSEKNKARMLPGLYFLSTNKTNKTRVIGIQGPQTGVLLSH